MVDFGSNIGISALYFLSRNPSVFVYCHEPLRQNTDRLKATLRGYEGRYEVREVALAEQDGAVGFSAEPTGRYGRISHGSAETISVPARDSNRVLGDILARHGGIDLLKLDIEGFEEKLIARMPPDLPRQIRRIVAEKRFRVNPLVATHEMSYARPITTFRLRSA